MAYDIEEQKRAIEDFLAGRVEPEDIELRPGLAFSAVFTRYPEGMRALIEYDALRFDEVRHSFLGPVLDDTLLMQVETRRMRDRDDMMFVLDGIERKGAYVGRRRFFAARAPDGRLVVREKADAVRDMTRAPRPRDDEPFEFDPHAPIERTPEEDVDDAAIAPGF